MDADVREQLHILQNEINVLQQNALLSSSQCRLSGADIRCGVCHCIDDFRLRSKYYCDCQHLTPKRDCLAFYQSGQRVSGIYQVTQNNLKTIRVFCDQTTDNGGWTVFQRRQDGSVNFNVDWVAYKEGFGELQNEFWLGNENIFTMSHQGLHPKGNELRIDFMDWNLKRYFAKYDEFGVGNELTSYALHVGKYIEQFGVRDGLASKTGVKFTTYDRDNDEMKNFNCAQIYSGGWWFGSTYCHVGHLNEVYYKLEEKFSNHQGICWPGIKWPKYSMKQVEMKMRRKI